ncbi:MAG: isoprenylcysteine carboxylmethyltransferase family protein [Syntrophomonadaceae bacterium]|nr:isoprenylcysteine carboxylmethyltransferase family protein [Syntrophomonadaceae bacterium]
MNSRKRGVMVRMLIAVGIFVYVGYKAREMLPAFDINVIIAFFLLYLFWTTVAEALIYKDPDEYVIEDDDKKSYIYLQLTFMIALFFATIDFVGLHWTRVKALEPNVVYAGFAVFAVSCLVRWWGFNSLGKYFNPRVAVYENHQLITTGAYKNIRHPLYLGSLLSFLAIPMVFNSWGALLLILAATVPALVYRIKVEEELLARYFGQEYSQYAGRTKKLIPGIW